MTDRVKEWECAGQLEREGTNATKWNIEVFFLYIYGPLLAKSAEVLRLLLRCHGQPEMIKSRGATKSLNFTHKTGIYENEADLQSCSETLGVVNG